MSEQLGDDDHGPGPELASLYRTWAEGGTGLLLTGNVMIDRRYLGEPRNVVLEDDRHLEAFESWARAGTHDGAHLWMQINHAGKQIPSHVCREPVAPSAIALGSGLGRFFNTPRALDQAEIEEIIARFATTAALAKQAGFSGVQIHGAHGYLISQFLSPKHNQRTDAWGGDATRRRRFVLEVYAAVRDAVGESFPIGIKLNSADFQRGGFSEDESMSVVQALAEAGIDMIEISGGTYERPAMMGKQKTSTMAREAYFLEYAQRVRAIADTPLAVTGGFRSGAAMSEALADSATDLIGIARPLCVQPDFPRRLLEDPMARVEVRTPTTGIAMLDRLLFVEFTWYERQIRRIARGQKPERRLGAWRCATATAMQVGRHSLRPRRA